MPKFGKQSNKNLNTAHPKLQLLFREVVKTHDCSVICGHRNEEEQNKAFISGHSNKAWPDGEHNTYLSNAVDVLPYPFKPKDWKDLGKLYMFVGYVKAVADMLNIKIRCGADWDGDGSTKDQNFHDLPHFELDK